MMGQTTALIVLCLGSALGWAVLRAWPRLRILAPPLLGVALGLAPQSAFLLAEYIGGTEILKKPAYAASVIAYDHIAVWMREHLAVIKDLPAEILIPAVIALAIGALVLRRPIVLSLPMRVLRFIGSLAFIASIATTFTLATGNPAWEPAPDAQLRAELRGAMHDAVALNLQKEMTAEPPVLDAEEINRFTEFLKKHIRLLSGDPCAEPRPAASDRNTGFANAVPCRALVRGGNPEEQRRRVLAIVLDQAVEEGVRTITSGLPDAGAKSASDSYAARAALQHQRPPPDQPAERARQVIVLITTRALDFSFSSTPLAGDVANAYFDIAKHEVVEALVGDLPIEAMFRVAENFSAVARRMFASARTPLLRIILKPAVAPDADKKFTDADRVVIEQMQREAEDHDVIPRIIERATAPLRDLRR
jgi:hypothetical protein